MRRRVGPAGGRRLRPAWALSALTAPAIGVLLLSAHLHSAERLAARLATAATTLSRHAPRAPQTLVNARQFGGASPVGALFTLVNGQLGRHFCTASVVDSKPGDLVLTAAHCVSNLGPGEFVFVPGYRNGQTPHGVWTVSKVVVDAGWRKSANPDHDFAFLVVGKSNGGDDIQQVTGGERLGTGWPARVRVHVAGYPDAGGSPIICQRRTRPFGAHQMKFVCGGFTGGTSGGPFLATMSSATGEGTVIGVIGGYQQGGDLAWVSYSPRFGHAVRALYEIASAGG
jgi:V8-like Glu-specific endopeptidase